VRNAGARERASGRFARKTHQDAGRMEGQVSLAREPRLGAGIFASMRVGEAEEPLDAVRYGPLENLGGAFDACGRL
jgi:hypothetical protein